MTDLKYFRSQIVPTDIGTMVYWSEDQDGRATDILPENIPEGSAVTDVTYERDTRTVIKAGGRFIAGQQQG